MKKIKKIFTSKKGQNCNKCLRERKFLTPDQAKDSNKMTTDSKQTFQRSGFSKNIGSFSTSKRITSHYNLNNDLVFRTEFNNRKRPADLFNKRHAMLIEEGSIFDLEIKSQKESLAKTFPENSVQTKGKSGVVSNATSEAIRVVQIKRKNPGTDYTISHFNNNNPNSTIISFSIGQANKARMCMSINKDMDPRGQSNHDSKVIEADYFDISIPEDLEVTCTYHPVNVNSTIGTLVNSASDTTDLELVSIDIRRRSIRQSNSENKNESTCKINVSNVKQQTKDCSTQSCDFECLLNKREFTSDISERSQNVGRWSLISDTGSFVSVRGAGSASSVSISHLDNNNPNSTIISFSVGKANKARMCMSINKDMDPRGDEGCFQSNHDSKVIEADYFYILIPEDLEVTCTNHPVNVNSTIGTLVNSASDTRDLELVSIDIRQRSVRKSNSENKNESTCTINVSNVKQQTKDCSTQSCDFEYLLNKTEFTSDISVRSQNFGRLSLISETGSFVSVSGAGSVSSVSSDSSFISIRGWFE